MNRSQKIAAIVALGAFALVILGGFGLSLLDTEAGARSGAGAQPVMQEPTLKDASNASAASAACWRS